MARRTKEEALQTRARIFAAALDLFAAKGYARTTFDDIARRLNMTKGAVYWHFKSKEALLLEIIRMMQDEFTVNVVKNLSPSEMSFDALRTMMVDLAMHIASDSECARFFTLMTAQIEWSGASMKDLRIELSKSEHGPDGVMFACLKGLQARHEIRSDISAKAYATVLAALWQGLLSSAVSGFLNVPLDQTMTDGFNAIYQSIQVRK